MQDEAKAFLEMSAQKMWTLEQGIKDNIEGDNDDEDKPKTPK